MANYKGGYIIIDLEGKEIGEGITVKGIYDILEGATKPILIKGVVASDVEYKPTFAPVYVSGTDFIIEINSTISLTVDDDDKVTVVTAEDDT